MFRKVSCVLFLLTTSLFVHFHSSYAEEEPNQALRFYQCYEKRLMGFEKIADLSENGFDVIQDQSFALSTQAFGDVYFIPAVDRAYRHLALFFAKADGRIVYRTDRLETNNRNQGALEQLNAGMAAVSFQDLDENGLTDIILITYCVNTKGAYTGRKYKVGDVLFQNQEGFYRDYRLSDKMNRFGMNKSAELIASYIRDGYSTEFLYTATTLRELLDHGFEVMEDQRYWRVFEKLGRLQVVPGTYHMAEYTEFLIYLVNEQGYIVWSFQPMGNYESLYALRGITCRDIDGDGLKDLMVLGRYSYEGTDGKSIIQSDYEVYYQRTGGFYREADDKNRYQCTDNDTLAEIVQKMRAYWGWSLEE